MSVVHLPDPGVTRAGNMSPKGKRNQDNLRLHAIAEGHSPVEQQEGHPVYGWGTLDRACPACRTGTEQEAGSG